MDHGSDAQSQRHDQVLADVQQWNEPSSPADQERQRLEQFRRNVLRFTPSTFVTHGIVLANVAVFAVMVLSGVHPLNPSSEDLIHWGANYGPRTLAGQWWRLFTSTFIHVGLIHLAVNMWVLWSAGGMVERLLGNTGFLVMYLASGIAGSLASAYWNPSVVSAGASGAVFGVIGALGGFLLASRGSIPSLVFRGVGRSIGVFLFYSLAFGLLFNSMSGRTGPGIDMAAHLGGLAAGLLCGLIMGQRFDDRTGQRRIIRNLLAAVLGVLMIGLGVSAAPPPPADVPAEVERVDQTQSRLIDAYDAIIADWHDQKLTSEAAADRLETEVLPDWTAQRQRLQDLRGLNRWQADEIAHIAKYFQLREESWRLRAQAIRTGDPGVYEAYEAKAAEVDRYLKEPRRTD